VSYDRLRQFVARFVIRTLVSGSRKLDACCLWLGSHSQCPGFMDLNPLLAQALVACRLTLDACLDASSCLLLALDAPAPSVSSGVLRNILDDTTFFSPIDLKNLSQLRTYDAGSCSLDLIKYHIKLFLVIRISVYHMQRLELICPNTLCSPCIHYFDQGPGRFVLHLIRPLTC
jgi:hypothetical protein